MTPEQLIDVCRGLPLLRACGEPWVACPPGVKMLQRPELALREFYTTGRDYLKVEAQGDLTGWLAKHAYEKYGGVWNNRARQYSAAIETIVEQVELPAALTVVESDLRPFIRSMIVLYAMECSYSEFPGRPRFFNRVMTVLEKGHIPFGCELPWPTKVLLVY
jgi:hypothetical protein